MQLIVITPERTFKGELATVNRLFANGLQRLHIRKPSFNADDYRNYISEIDKQYYNRIVIHGAFELYSELNSGGIHLNTAARNNPKIWEVIAHLPASAISASFHSWDEILENEFHYRYVFISPVFDSISKKGYRAGIEVSGAQETKNSLYRKKRYCPKIVGLGGVGKEQVKIMLQSGFDGIAVLGAIWLANDPVTEFMKISATLASPELP